MGSKYGDLLCIACRHHLFLSSIMVPTATTETRKKKVPQEHKTKVEAVQPQKGKKPQVLAPPPDGESEVQPKKSQLRSSKQRPRYISANANARPIKSKVKSSSLKKRKAKSPTPSNSDKNAENDEDEGVMGQAADSETEDVHLHGFSTDEDDSSDEEDDKPGLSAFEVSRLPTVAKDDEIVQQKLEKAKRKPVC